MQKQVPTELLHPYREKRIADYRGIASDKVLDEIDVKARQLASASVVHVNATNFGGGVAEILNSFVLLMNDLGLRTDWRVLHGTPDFFEVTKKFHNALQGQNVAISDEELELYEFTNARFARYADLGHDYVIVHDPQPCGLVHYVAHNTPWVWRCHIDITRPNQRAWEFFKPFIETYERMIVSSEDYKNGELEVDQIIVSPSIDPLSLKNLDLPQQLIDQYLAEYAIPTDLPIITQVSRFDPWKDPEGVLEAWKLVNEQTECRLLFCYNIANDDPEAVRIYQQMYELAAPFLETGQVLFVRGDDPILVNAIQRVSDVVLQKSTREGFGLTVTEAMWKGTPVVASRIGGIPTQIEDGQTGFLVEPRDLEAAAQAVNRLLRDRDLAREIGRQAQEAVREKFLITRHLLDYLNLMLGA